MAPEPNALAAPAHATTVVEASSSAADRGLVSRRQSPRADPIRPGTAAPSTGARRLLQRRLPWVQIRAGGADAPRHRAALSCRAPSEAPTRDDTNALGRDLNTFRRRRHSVGLRTWRAGSWHPNTNTPSARRYARIDERRAYQAPGGLAIVVKGVSGDEVAVAPGARCDPVPPGVPV